MDEWQAALADWEAWEAQVSGEVPPKTSRTEFLIALDEEMLEYFRDMVDVLVERCGVSRAEAVARINATYGQDPSGVLIMGHELPEYWAYGAYYRPDDQDRLPTGDPAYDATLDFTRLPLRPAPPRDSRCWTVREEQDA